MKLPRYPVAMSREKMTFEFVSEGKKKRILKVVQYDAIGLHNVYNLAFGDKDPLTGEIDDEVISNNGDRDKVLATVAATVYEFTSQYPDARIYVTGSTEARTRLYRMGISGLLDEIANDFVVLGELGGSWEMFKSNTEYVSFLVIRKSKH